MRTLYKITIFVSVVFLIVFVFLQPTPTGRPEFWQQYGVWSGLSFLLGVLSGGLTGLSIAELLFTHRASHGSQKEEAKK